MRLAVKAATFVLLSLAMHRAGGQEDRVVIRKVADCRNGCLPLLIFSPTQTDPRLAQQVNQIARTGDRILRREVMIFLFVEAKPVRAWRINGGDSLSEEWNTLDRENPSAVRKRFHAEEGAFTVLLAGRNGRESFRSGEPVPIAKLLNVIDAASREESRGR